MSGLDNIIQTILTDGEKIAQDIVAKAKTQADKHKQNQLEEARLEAEQLLQKAESEANILLQRGQSAAQLEANRLILEAKVVFIRHSIDAVHHTLLNLPTADYWNIIRNFIISKSLPQSGEVVLSLVDQKRLPENFFVDLSKEIGHTIQLSSQIRKLTSGCILIYDEIEFNGEFSALIYEKSDMLKDLLHQELFSPQENL